MPTSSTSAAFRRRPFRTWPKRSQHLKSLGFKVSVDSLEPDDLLRGGRAGADYLLSLREDTLWIADEVAATPILIPREPGDLASLERAIDALERKGRAYLADPVLDPIHFGFTDSLARYHALRRARPQAPIMMGIGNLTELTYADTMGMNALLFGIASELGIAAVLVVQVSEHARSVVREADLARRIMFAARADHALPKNYSHAMLALHEKRPFTHTPAEIAELAAGVRDPNFRIMLSEEGVHVFNRAGHHRAVDPFAFWPLPELEDDRRARLLSGRGAGARADRLAARQALRAGRGAALGRCRRASAGESARAEGRRNDPRPSPPPRREAQSRMIWEAVVTSMSSAGQVHIAPMGFREVEGRVVLAPFRPSTTLDNLARHPLRGSEPHRRRACLRRLPDRTARVAHAALRADRHAFAWTARLRTGSCGWRTSTKTSSGPACTSTSSSNGRMRRSVASTAPRPRSSRRRSW